MTTDNIVPTQAARIMAAFRRDGIQHVDDEALDEFEALVLTPMLEAFRLTAIAEEREAGDAAADRAGPYAVLSMCNNIMATVLASTAPDGGNNNFEAKIERIVAKIEQAREAAQRAITEARIPQGTPDAR